MHNAVHSTQVALYAGLDLGDFLLAQQHPEPHLDDRKLECASLATALWLDCLPELLQIALDGLEEEIDHGDSGANANATVGDEKWESQIPVSYQPFHGFEVLLRLLLILSRVEYGVEAICGQDEGAADAEEGGNTGQHRFRHNGLRGLCRSVLFFPGMSGEFLFSASTCSSWLGNTCKD